MAASCTYIERASSTMMMPVFVVNVIMVNVIMVNVGMFIFPEYAKMAEYDFEL